jgi:prepilin-type N-terminal cleavage/methylation domain-containing protein
MPIISKNPEDMMPDEINTEISMLETQRAQINARLGALRLRLALDACPYQVGEVLVNRQGERARIDEVFAPQNILTRDRGYAMRGVYLKKDGTPAMNPGRDNTRPRSCPFSTWDDWKRPDGFTLIEGIIVLAILAILAVVVIPPLVQYFGG